MKPFRYDEVYYKGLKDLNITRSKEGEPKKVLLCIHCKFYKEHREFGVLTPWMAINCGYYNKWYPVSQLINMKCEVFRESDDLKEE